MPDDANTLDPTRKEVHAHWTRDVLRYAGFRTLEAEGGNEGVALAVEHVPDLVLMDIRMPDMNGTEALRRLRGDTRTAEIPIVALTPVP